MIDISSVRKKHHPQKILKEFTLRKQQCNLDKEGVPDRRIICWTFVAKSRTAFICAKTQEVTTHFPMQAYKSLF